MNRRKALEQRETKIENWGHTLSNMVYCEISHDEGRTKGSNCYTWSFRPLQKANMTDEKSVLTHNLCDETHERRVEPEFKLCSKMYTIKTLRE
jgi:hypothetical protein